MIQDVFMQKADEQLLQLTKIRGRHTDTVDSRTFRQLRNRLTGKLHGRHFQDAGS
jgi:hypothetical protein